MIGSVTLENMRLSIVGGNAFVDFSSDVFGDHIGDKLIVYDSAGKKAIGYIKAAGTGETLGPVLNTSNCINHPTSGFDTFDGVSATGFYAIRSTAGTKYAGTALEIPFVAGGLFKLTATLVGGTLATVPRTGLASTMLGSAGALSEGSNAKYATITQTVTGLWSFYATSNGERTLSNIAVQQVLTPSATGVTITSTRGGTTYNWESVEAGFNFNDASGYTYSIVASRDILYEDNDILVMDIKDAPTTNGTSTIIYASDFNCKKLSIENIRHSIYGVKLVLSFDATIDDKCLIITGNDTIDIGNPILNPMSAGYTGDIVLTTLGVTEDSTYNLIIKLRKY